MEKYRDIFVAAVKKVKEEQLKSKFWDSALRLIVSGGAMALNPAARDGFTIADMVQNFNTMKSTLDQLQNGETDPNTGLRVTPPKNLTGRAFLITLPGMEVLPPDEFQTMWNSWNETLATVGENAKFIMSKNQVG